MQRTRLASSPADRHSTASAEPPRVRPFETADLTAAASLSAAAFGLDISEPSAAERWRGRGRVEHLLRTDPRGAFIAERDSRIIGVAQAMRRQRLRCLSLLAVRPGVQSHGAGRALMERVLTYALAIAGSSERPLVRWITTGQDWAVEVCLRAGLRLTAYGALCVRGHPGPLRPYIPIGPFA